MQVIKGRYFMEKKRQQGILTVEASIVLTLLILLVLFLFSFGRVYRAQSLVSHATLQAADAVALESYLRETALQSDASDVLYLASSLTDSTSLSAENLESLRSADIPKVAREKFITAVSNSESNADEKLKNLGVKDGLSGIDFSECKVDLGNDDVIVAITYTIEMQFPVFGADELTVTKSAKAKTFGEILFEVATEPNVPGWGTTSGDSKVVHGTTVEITATPNYGYKFVSWDDGVTDNPRTVTVTDALHYKAIFEKDKFGVNVSVGLKLDNPNYANITHANYGSVSGAATYEYLDVATLTATPSANYYFAGWDDNGDGEIDNTNATRPVTVDKTYNIKAIFKPTKYTITVKANNSTYGTAQVQQGTTKGNQIVVEYGSAIQLVATTKDNVLYIFSKWSNNSAQETTTVQVNANQEYIANFIPNTYSVTFKNGNSVVHTTNVIRNASIDGSKRYISSSMPSSNPTQNGATFDKWVYNGATFNSATVVKTNITVSAGWKCTVTLNANGGTSGGSSSKNYTVSQGAKFNFSNYTPYRNGYTFNGWYSGGNKYSGNKTIKSNVSLSASWSCKHTADNGVSMYYPTSSTGGGCSNSKTTYRCGGCAHQYSVNGRGACVYEGWCGTIHNAKNPWTSWCTSGSSHKWKQYGCITCIHCGRCEQGKYDSYGVYRSGVLWCIKHNGHLNRKVIKESKHQ